MIKMFNSTQSKQLDRYTIRNQSINSADLMERAARKLFEALTMQVDKSRRIIVFAGTGNNGGDALATARMLFVAGYIVEVYIVNPNNKMSEDCSLNKCRLEQLTEVFEIIKVEDIPSISPDCIIIDGLFGIGLNRPIEDRIYLNVINAINESLADVFSIDIPSGMFADANETNNREGVVKAECVLTIQYPKLAMLLPHDETYFNSFQILDIGLSVESMDNRSTDYYYIEKPDVVSRLRRRPTFSHKGTYGHALLISGSYSKMGAAVLSSRACICTGVGLLTVHVPKQGVDILQTTVPEAMVSVDQNDEFIIGLSGQDISKLTIGIGPAIGLERETSEFMNNLFELNDKPMVIDADALNLIAKDDLLKRKIPKNSILTPHPLEFDRLIGKRSESGYSRLQYARQFAQKYQVYLVLKGAYSALISPDGKVCFNSSGNPGMATGGSGDVLTGILTSLLAQKYTPYDAMLVGVYLHGLAADIAVAEKSEEALLASDIIEHIGKAYLWLKKSDF